MNNECENCGEYTSGHHHCIACQVVALSDLTRTRAGSSILFRGSRVDPDPALAGSILISAASDASLEYADSVAS